jgi:hypothetical protein
MARVHEPEVERPEGSEATRRIRLLSAVVAAPALSTVAVVQTHSMADWYGREVPGTLDV